ncbi:hypothetical protein [Halalkalibacillus sediminis]|uniref:hypothetical protein n=1 Tax=Halalkalibacillus sediminis TaxID=2018042 RepID=UPI00192E627D|nr:hypothetical protein [Halalkalibacillus sediminis]
MNRFFYGLYAFLLGVISLVTGEIVTFVLLGFILMTLHSIHSTLKEILEVNKRGKEQEQ